ncbi:MAG TPA: NfeD family protein [Candidatus Acidoferrales bacterium]|jgi:membrane-bound ClpP family serine protease|nr:NfeD family protein [Candidatus Acidoferrales bacterium]
MIIYAICLVVGLAFTLLSAVFGHFMGGHDSIDASGHAESGLAHDGEPGISFFSPTVLASFLTAFGAVGMILTKIDATHSVWISAPISMVAGFIIASGVLWFFNTMFSKTQSSSESRVATLIGQTAAIVTPIPENGVGEISYVQSGSRYTAAARAEKGTMIASGKTVKITRIVGSQFFVESNE